jgi:hypothetical protein
VKEEGGLCTVHNGKPQKRKKRGRREVTSVPVKEYGSGTTKAYTEKGWEYVALSDLDVYNDVELHIASLDEVEKFAQSNYPDMPSENWYHGIYCKTNHWKITRNVKLKVGVGKCCMCSSDDRLSVHHNTYERLWRELNTDLALVCNSCHWLFERNKSFRKRRALDCLI